MINTSLTKREIFQVTLTNIKTFLYVSFVVRCYNMYVYPWYITLVCIGWLD